MRKGYLVFVAIAMAAPYAVFLPWVAEHGLDLGRFAEQALASPLSTFLVVDVAVSAIAVVFLAGQGLRRGDIRMMWPILGTLTVGASLGLPLYLYLTGGKASTRTRSATQSV